MDNREHDTSSHPRNEERNGFLSLPCNAKMLDSWYIMPSQPWKSSWGETQVIKSQAKSLACCSYHTPSYICRGLAEDDNKMEGQTLPDLMFSIILFHLLLSFDSESSHTCILRWNKAKQPMVKMLRRNQARWKIRWNEIWQIVEYWLHHGEQRQAAVLRSSDVLLVTEKTAVLRIIALCWLEKKAVQYYIL